MHTKGFHHVTAIASDPKTNVDFYVDVLGLRLVRRTINSDETSTYHLYFGDEVGTAGTALMLFPFAGIERGQSGRGQPTATAFAVPNDATGYRVGRTNAG